MTASHNSFSQFVFFQSFVLFYCISGTGSLSADGAIVQLIILFGDLFV